MVKIFKLCCGFNYFRFEDVNWLGNWEVRDILCESVCCWVSVLLLW